MWFGSLRQQWEMPPAPPLGIPMSPLAPLKGDHPSLALCKGSPWLSTALAGKWDDLFVEIGVFWPLRSAAATLDYAVGFDELHFICNGPANFDVDVHIPIIEPLGEARCAPSRTFLDPLPTAPTMRL
eukprot:scaffold58147_cov31-Tisochrysis_lutea.AAC.2